MHLKKNWLCILLAIGCLSAVGAGCGDDDPSSDAGGDGDAGDGDAGDGDGDGDGDDSPLLDAPAAEEVGSVELEEPLSDVVYAEDLALGLHEESGVSILDMSDPTAPRVISRMPTSGRAIGVSLDVRLRILFIVTVTGELRAYRVGDVENPVMAATSSIQEPGSGGNPIQGMVRLADRLYLLGETHLLPVSVLIGASGSIGFLAETEVSIGDGAFSITYGGRNIYIAFGGGRVQTWRGGDSPEMLGEAELGADIVGWVARGNRLLVALQSLGLRVLNFNTPDAPATVFDAPEFNDLEGLERFGNLVIVSLSRGLLVALDLSDFSAPRSLVTRRGDLPAWIAPIGGNLILGGGTSLSIFGVPPFISASVPAISRGQFPRYGKIPLQLSKPVDPTTVTIDNVILSCGGTQVSGSVVVSLDFLKITFVPDETLPAGVTCTLSFDGVQDALGLPLSSGDDAVSFDTMSADPAPIENPHSSYAHTADGAFTDWEEGKTEDFEYFDVTAARGMYSYFYADYDGEKLWLLNDWFYNSDDIDPDCYNQFGVWTGNGSQSWDIRAYGDQRIEVRLNGTLLEEGDERVSGGYQHTGTPNDPETHTIYELSVETEPGSWGVQLHDPGPTFSCQNLETDPTNYNGASMADTTMIDPTQGPVAPTEPISTSRTVTTTTPTLTWSVGDGQQGDNPGAFTSYVFVLSSGDDLSNVFFKITVYGQLLVLPQGLLQDGATYTWQVTAYNLAGSATSEPITFTVGDAPTFVAPELTSVDPTGTAQGSSPSVTVNGTGFVEGARGYFNGVELSTTFISSTQLSVMLTEALTSEIATYDITVRNDPDDESTESNGIKFNINVAQSTQVTLVSISPSMAVQNTSSAVTVTLSDASAGSFVLNLTPDAGGSGAVVTCTMETATTCMATVPELGAGLWDLYVTVTIEGEAPYNTNTLDQGLMVSAPTLTTLVSVNPESIEANTVRMFNVVMTNAPSGDTYTVIAQPTGGGQATTFTCTSSQTNSCAAAVNLPAGTYNIAIRVGLIAVTNVLSSALTVTAPAECVHDECLPGARLGSGCSSCATSICNTLPACCTTSWTDACVSAANSSAACSCSAPSIVSLDPTVQTDGASTQVTVNLANAPAGPSYSLQLPPLAGGDGTIFPCVYQAGSGDCIATVTGDPVGVYDAYVRVQNNDVEYFTNILPDAFTVQAASSCPTPTCGGSASSCSCEGGGFMLTCTSAGACECLDSMGLFVNDGSSFQVCDSVPNAEAAFRAICCP